MTYGQRQGFMKAFFVTKVLAFLVPTNETLDAQVRQQIPFINTLINMTGPNADAAILQRVNQAASKNWTLMDMGTKVGQAVADMTACAQCSIAVSYTHLDVYKRQVLH